MSSSAPFGRTGSSLFLSCDLVGSTSHKQTAAGPRRWIPDFLTFYYDFPALVRSRLSNALSAKLVFWKAVGDELLYVADVDHEGDVYEIVLAWVQAMGDYEARMRETDGKTTGGFGSSSSEGRGTPTVAANKMTLKGGAFLATFPVPDFVVAVPLRPQAALSERDPFVVNEELKNAAGDERLIDDLGPSVDTGFRVVHECSQRYFTLSMEVAWALAHHAHYGPPKLDAIDGMTLLREAEMKGVWQGREYPLFAIDRRSDDQIVQKLDAIRGARPVPAIDVTRLAFQCAAAPDWPSRIFLADSREPAFTSVRKELTDAQLELASLVDRSGESEDLKEAVTNPSADEQRDVDSMLSRPSTPPKPPTPSRSGD